MQAIIDRLDAQFADPGYRYALLRREDWQTLEAAESQTTAVQQLKAEIAALIPKFDESFTHGDEYMYNILVNKLRQLSAV